MTYLPVRGCCGCTALRRTFFDTLSRMSTDGILDFAHSRSMLCRDVRKIKQINMTLNRFHRVER
jgi:hypothetical protein